MTREEDLVRQVARATLERDMENEDWEKALAIDGLLALDDEQFVDAARSLVDGVVAAQGDEGNLGYDDPKPWIPDSGRAQSEASALGNGVLEFYERTGDDTYLEAAEKQYRYLVEETVRTEGGTVSYTTEPTGLWVDSLYLMGVFLAHYGDVTDTPEAFDEATLHVRELAKHLQDPHTDLFRHEWRETPNSYPESTLWSRGNGWVAAGILDILQYLPESHEDRDELVDVFRRLCDSVRRRQDSSGFWHHILDDPATALETSGTLQFAYTFEKGTQLGYLEDDAYRTAAEEAFEVCQGVVDAEGNVRRVAVPPGGPNTPLGVTSYGQGWFLLAADVLGARRGGD